ncbi:12916_t:CDS:2 [Acaulospora morrowiae]|uniref:12916_t:CDS:1 n=1 Tax=Acaulospora morrowiae TaxID=94023 RepID=A0A9N8Z9J9_9GLOM|nr:12916_t:CDS:2 [Acaulospora morrowiae]
MSQKSKVIVIGAGVSGLTTALVLQRNGYQVQIFAEHFPGDSNINYTSPSAGADWRSELISIPNLSNLEAISFKTLWSLSEFPETGLMRLQSFTYMDEKPKLNGDPWFKDLVPKFRVIPQRNLPKGVEYGCSYTSITVDVPKYLRWLQTQFIDAGGKIKRVHLSHINEALDEDVDIVVNCTGISARTLGGVEDDTVFPTRGQTVIVWAPHVKKICTRIGADYITYVIPRQDGVVVLGGVLGKPDQKTAESIIKRCTELCPELALGKEYLEIISNNVGRRPSRTGGIRIESELRKNSKGKDIIVCHNYGHHARGYSTSWGSSSKALELIETALKTEQINAKL